MVDFNIYDVASVNSLQKINKNVGIGRTAYICPFCGDKKGRFTVSKDAGHGNVYKCFHCDASGGMISLHKKLNNISTGSDAAKDIIKKLPFVTKRECVSVPKKIMAQKEKPASYKTKVYFEMLKLLTLEDKHKEDLKRRGLNDEQIKKYLFRSTPKSGIDIARKLQKKGYDLEGVAGFYINKRGLWDMNIQEGYFCPVYDYLNKTLVGLQIRLDKPKDKRKYIWFSSTNRKKGCSSHSPVTYLEGRSNIVIVTEGILKATITYEFLGGAFTVIGVAGVNSLGGLKPYLNCLKGQVILEAYDMDKYPPIDATEKELEKTEIIKKAVEKLKNTLPKECSFSSLKWNLKNGVWDRQNKGIDDLFNAQNEREMFLIKQSLAERR